MSIVAAELVARVSADTGPADRELRGWAGRLGSKSGPFAGIGAVFGGNLLSGAVQGLGRGIADVGRIGVGVFADMASAGMDFEAQMDAVAAVLGGTAAEADALGDLAIELAVDPNLKVNATEAAEAITNLATAGLTAEEILGGATKATVLLANSTGGSFGQAATVATDVMSLFNIEAADMMEAVDGIAAVSNVSKFDLNDYALALSQAGGVAALSGVEFDEFNAVIASTSSYFASGSDAGTSFKTFLQRLQPTTQEAKDLMFELGLVTEDNQSAFYNANGELRTMNEIYGIMNKTFGSMTEAQKSFYLSQIFGTDAMRTAGAIADMTDKQFGELLNTMDESSALDSAKIRTDNFKSALENLGGAVEAVKLSIWDQLEGPAQELVVAITPLIEWIAPMAVDYAKQLGEWLSDRIAEVTATAKVTWNFTNGDILATVMTSIARLTDAEIEFDALGIVRLDWGDVDMEFDAVGNVTMQWEGRAIGASTSWGPDKPMEVEAHVNWGNVYEDFKMAMTNDTGSWADLFRLPTFKPLTPGTLFGDMLTKTYEIGVKVGEVDWGDEWTKAREMAVSMLADWGDIWSEIYSVVVNATVDWGGVWDSAKTIVVNLIPNWLGGGDAPPPPADPAAGVPRFRTDRQRGSDGWSGADENATGNPMFGGGWTWVGERGPELVRLPRASRIYDAEDSRGMGGGVTVNQQYIVRNPIEADIAARKTAEYLRRKQRR